MNTNSELTGKKNFYGARNYLNKSQHQNGKLLIITKIYESLIKTCLLIYRNHPFDDPNKRKARRKIKFGTVSGPSAPSRGALPVRQFHRKDESKILPSKRLGIEMP